MKMKDAENPKTSAFIYQNTKLHILVHTLHMQRAQNKSNATIHSFQFNDVLSKFYYQLMHKRTALKWVLKFTLTLRRLMSYIYGAPILDVSRSHTTTQHSR